MKYFKWNLFFTSFLPLWVTIIAYDVFAIIKNTRWCLDLSFKKNIYLLLKNNIISVIVILTLLILLLISIFYMKKVLKEKSKNQNNLNASVVNAKLQRKISSEFLVAYILPMFVFDFSRVDGIIMFLIYFLFLSYIAIRNNNIYTNILLEFMGYKIYIGTVKKKLQDNEVEYSDSIIISKDNLANSKEHYVEYFDFENYVYIILKGDN